MARHRNARIFAAGFPVFFLPVFALPLFMKPYEWARRFGWREEPETDVGLYFGRCLGAIAVGGCVQSLEAARDPEANRSFFTFAEVASWTLAVAHVRGMIERRQPPIENAEIAMWSAAALAARAVRP